MSRRTTTTMGAAPAVHFCCCVGLRCIRSILRVAGVGFVMPFGGPKMRECFAYRIVSGLVRCVAG